MMFLRILVSMRILLIIGAFGVGLSLTGCVLPVVVDQHRNRGYYDDGRNSYPVSVGVAPVVEVRR